MWDRSEPMAAGAGEALDYPAAIQNRMQAESLAPLAAPDNSWLIDMMITIMHSNTWNEPLTGFITDKCMLFDNFEEENKHAYMEVHNEFKILVDNLLAAHLIEVDIMPEEFEKQLIESGLIEDPRLQQVVGQLMAAEDFMTFKTMMVERHTSMQMQAMSNYQDMATSEDVAAIQAAGGMMPTYAPAAAVAAAPMPASSTGAVATPPSMQQERAFGAGGGFYGRAAIPGSTAPASKEKADAIRKALVGGLRGGPR